MEETGVTAMGRLAREGAGKAGGIAAEEGWISSLPGAIESSVISSRTTDEVAGGTTTSSRT